MEKKTTIMNKKMLKIFCVSEKSLQRCLRSAGIISVPLTQRQQPKLEFPMHMISGFSSSFFSMKIPHLRIIK